MNIPITFTGLKTEATENLQQITIEKFARMDKFSVNVTSIHVTFHIDKLSHIAEATIRIPKKEIHAKAEANDMHKAVDSLINKLVRQLAKYKEKITDHS